MNVLDASTIASDDALINDAKTKFAASLHVGSISIEEIQDAKQGYMSEKYGVHCTDDSINSCGVNIMIMFIFLHLGLMNVRNLYSIINYYCGAIAFTLRGSLHRNYAFVCPIATAKHLELMGLTSKVLFFLL